MPSREEMKEKALKKVQNAKNLAETLKKNAELAKKLAKNPPPDMVDFTEPSGDLEKDCLNELNDLQAGFRQRAKQENNRFELATDSEYWFAVCFQTREQKDFFLKEISKISNIYGDKYINGEELAAALNIKLPDSDVPYNTSCKKDKDWIKLT